MCFWEQLGGVVIIGVDDEKDVRGLERDYKLMSDERDDFELQLNQVISEKLGETFGSRYVTVEFHEINGEDVCAVHVDQCSQPVYFEDDDFYIRDGSSSRPLEMREAFDYIHDHWEIS